MQTKPIHVVSLVGSIRMLRDRFINRSIVLLRIMYAIDRHIISRQQGLADSRG